MDTVWRDGVRRSWSFARHAELPPEPAAKRLRRRCLSRRTPPVDALVVPISPRHRSGADDSVPPALITWSCSSYHRRHLQQCRSLGAGFLTKRQPSFGLVRNYAPVPRRTRQGGTTSPKPSITGAGSAPALRDRTRVTGAGVVARLELLEPSSRCPAARCRPWRGIRL